jgi:hypothetical protein
MSFVSAINQPERVFLSSYDDYSLPRSSTLWPISGAKYNKFLCRLPNPVLMPERSQLLRAAIPNITLNIPDYSLVFWYARQNKSTFAITYHNIRILPSYMDPNDTSWVQTTGLPVNRQITSYSDLLSILNQAASATDDDVLNPYHVPGDITFSYNSTTQLFSFSGNSTSTYRYFPIGYNWTGLEANNANVLLRFPGQAPLSQPFVSEITLNLRVGFVQPSNTATNGLVLPNRAQEYGPSVNELIVWIADSYADLVYSQNCIVLANYVQGSSVSSGGSRNILATVPMNAPPLGVSLFQAPLVNWLTKVAKEIYEIEITLLDDNGQPFLLPNSAVVNIDIGFSFTKI